jgi:hypothetical protein
MAATPTIEQVVDGVHGVINAIGSIGTVLKADHHLEDDVEFIEVGNYISGGALDLWFIDLDNPPTSPFEGQGVGEAYDRYNVRIRYWSMRTNDAEWSKKARIKALSVVEALVDNAAVFAIGGNPQLFTPTTVAITSHGPVQIRDVARAAGQMVYQTVIALTVEARRWT